MARPLERVRRFFGLATSTEINEVRRAFVEAGNAVSLRAQQDGALTTAGASVNVDGRFVGVGDQDIRDLIKNTTASAAVGFRTHAISSARFGAFEEDKDDPGAFIDLDQASKLAQFANKLAPLMSWIEFDLITAGRAFVWVNKVTHLVELWELERLDPSAVRPSDDQFREGAREDGVPASERVANVFYYSDPDAIQARELRLDPGNCLMLTNDEHLPELFQCVDAITLLNNIVRLNAAYFEKGVLPGRYAFAVAASNRIEFNATREKLIARYGKGVETAGEVNVHDDTKVKIQDLGESNREMEMLGGIDAGTRDIARALRIPSPLLNDPRRSTYNNVHEARLEFYNGTIRQRWQSLATQLTAVSAVVLDGYIGTPPRAWRFRFETANIEALREPLKDLLQYVQIAAGRAVGTVNDMRRLIGLPPITDDPSADELYLPPAGLAFGAPPPDDPADDEPEDDDDTGDDDSDDKDGDEDDDKDSEHGRADTEDKKSGFLKIGRKREKSALLTESQWQERRNRRRAEFDGYQRRLDGIDEQLAGRLAYVFRGLSDEVERSIARALKRSGGRLVGLSAANLFNQERAELELRREAFNVLQGAFVNEFNVAATSVDVARTRLLSLPGEAYLTNRVAYFSGEVTGSVRDRLADWINESTSGQLPPREFAKEVRTLFNNEITNGRSRLIARTESTAVANFAHHEAYAEGNVAEVEWVAQLDDRVRESHREANGQRVELGQPFTIDGEAMLHPGDGSQGASARNVVNCRCVSLPT